MPADAKDINLLFTRMRLSEQRTRRPAIELAIKNAEEVFREEELADDWRGHPLKTDRIASGQAMNDQPGYWAAGVRYAAPIAVAHVTAEAEDASDPRRFEKSIDDIIYAVAATTFEAKLSGYAKIGSQRERAVIDQFSRDVRNATHREMERLARTFGENTSRSRPFPPPGRHRRPPIRTVTNLHRSAVSRAGDRVPTGRACWSTSGA